MGEETCGKKTGRSEEGGPVASSCPNGRSSARRCGSCSKLGRAPRCQRHQGPPDCHPAREGRAARVRGRSPGVSATGACISRPSSSSGRASERSTKTGLPPCSPGPGRAASASLSRPAKACWDSRSHANPAAWGLVPCALRSEPPGPLDQGELALPAPAVPEPRQCSPASGGRHRLLTLRFPGCPATAPAPLLECSENSSDGKRATC
jgi:hypothetical protein